jgi:hypothetical protein
MTYKLMDIKQVCEVIYGRAIADRTWRKWKSKLGFNPYEKEVSEDKMTQLLTLANMKREKPYNPVTLMEVVKAKQKTLEEFRDTRYSYRLYLLPDECKGDDLQDIFKMVTGRFVAERTLYRWGELLNIPYSPNRKYGKDEVKQYISKIV